MSWRIVAVAVVGLSVALLGAAGMVEAPVALRVVGSLVGALLGVPPAP